MQETVEFKIAQIEEGLSRLHDQLDTNHAKTLLLLGSAEKTDHIVAKIDDYLVAILVSCLFLSHLSARVFS